MTIITGTTGDDNDTGNPGLYGGAGDDTITGLAGNDILLGRGGSDTLYGGDDSDFMRGGDANDFVYGGDGNDYVHGGEGDDLIDGGLGIDRASFYLNQGNEPAVGVTVDLNVQGVAQNTGHGMDTLVGIEHVSGTQYDDTLTGDGGANWIWGNTGNDHLYGGGGDDLMETGGGDTVVDGGSGTDVLSFNNYINGGGTVGVTVSLGLQGAPQASGIGSLTLSGLEGLTGSQYSDTLTGDGGDNTIDGNGGSDTLYGGAGADLLRGDGAVGIDTGPALSSGPIISVNDAGLFDADPTEDGADTLFGGAGDDTLLGGQGDDVLDGGEDNDVMDGGAGVDTLSYASASAGVTVGLWNTAAQNTGGAGTDTISGFEILIGSSFDDILVAGPGGSTLNGGAGNDTLVSLGGADTLNGGAGTLDWAWYMSSTAAVTVDLSVVGAQNTGGGGTDTLSGIENVAGTNFNDRLTGDANDNILNGGAGTDILNGAGGLDAAGYDYATHGVTVDLNLTGFQVVDSVTGDSDKLMNIESVYGSKYDDVLTGTAGNNGFIGGSGNDLIYGGAGLDWAGYFGAPTGVKVSLAIVGAQDTVGAGIDTLTGIEMLIGSAFNDTLIGGAGDDVLDGNLGDDILKGGSGVDTAFYGATTASAGVNVNLTIAGAQNTGGAGVDTLTGMENIYGSWFDDTLTGDGGVNKLEGSGGADSLYGGAGGDVLFGEADTIYDPNIIGVAGDDKLYGGLGIDSLFGGGGADLLDGGGGADGLNGGLGDDTYIVDNAGDIVGEGVSEGADTVRTTLGAYTLTKNVEALIFDGSGNFKGSGNASNNAITAGAGDDTLQGQAGDDTLSGLAGKDKISGGDGNDVLIGGAGADDLTGGLGIDAFVYQAVGDSVGSKGSDTINDFVSAQGDYIDLSALDADVGLANDQAFTFIGVGGFTHHAGELRYSVSGTTATVQADVDGDGVADFQIKLLNVVSLAATDFHL